MTTTALFGFPNQYDQVKQWKRLGKTTGRVPIQPDLPIYRKWLEILQYTQSNAFAEMKTQKNGVRGPITNYKIKVLTEIYKMAGLNPIDFEQGHQRGIYFAEFYENTKEFLCGKVTKAALKLKPLFNDSVEDITNRWRVHAIERYKNRRANRLLKPEIEFYDSFSSDLDEEDN